MHKKNSKGKRNHNDTKENVMENGYFNQQHHFQMKRKTIKKPDHHGYPLQQLQRNKNPLELRHLCEQQEKLILAEYRSNKFFHHHEFYQYVRGELANSKICKKIMRIKQMSNEEALQQMSRIQELKLHDNSNMDLVGLVYLQQKCDSQQVQTEQKVVFRHYQKKISMIEDNDDDFLEDLGVDRFRLRHDQAIQDQNQQNQKEDSQPVNYETFVKHQFYQNDDVFEF